MVDLVKGIRVAFVVIGGVRFGFVGIVMIASVAMVVVYRPGLCLCIMNDCLLDPADLEPNGVGIDRFVVVEVDAPVENRPGNYSSVVDSVVDL